MPLFLNHFLIGRRAGWFGVTGRRLSPALVFVQHCLQRLGDQRNGHRLVRCPIWDPPEERRGARREHRKHLLAREQRALSSLENCPALFNAATPNLFCRAMHWPVPAVRQSSSFSGNFSPARSLGCRSPTARTEWIFGLEIPPSPESHRQGQRLKSFSRWQSRKTPKLVWMSFGN
jgi:hypothetical protein